MRSLTVEAAHRRSARDVVRVTGVALIGWSLVQAVVPRASSPLQPLVLGIGACLVAASSSSPAGPGRGALLIVVGAVVTAVGVGLLPHLVKRGGSVMSLVAVAVLFAGIALSAVGGYWALRRRRRTACAAGAVAVVVAVAAAVAVVSPGVAATNVPATHVGATPAEVGLGFESVTVTTSDGTDLAAWYLPGAEPAGVVVLHGAGSTRSDVLDQAAALVRGGYATLLLDARGHGDSGGTAMDFGWHGDADVAAGVDFLASRPEIDPDRIGVVGFSMGGEEAIGAAAADPRIRAVIAEGATGRQAADKAWLSDVYGWRGWAQERVETAQDAVTRRLTDAPTPISLRSAVEHATDTRFLLITAGAVADEDHAASHIRSAAPDRVEVWTVDGAAHVGAYDRAPDEWQRRAVEFLDAALDRPMS